MQKFSCADFAFPHLSHENSLKLIKLMGIDYIDVGLFEDRSHIQPSGEFTDPEKNGALLKQKASDCGLGVIDIFMQTSLDFMEVAINHPEASVRNTQREIFKKLCDYSLAAECHHVSGLPGVYFDENSWSLCADELLWRVDYAKNLGLSYSVEAHYGSIIQDPKKALKMLQEDAKGLTLALDHSHYTFQGIPTAEIRPLMDYAAHMHARGAKPGEMQCSVERNDTDFALVAEHIKSAGYEGAICLEYTYTAWENCNRTDNVSETILLKDLLTKYLDGKWS